MCYDLLGFTHEDPHAALKDAARMVICAVNLAMKRLGDKKKHEQHLTEVARKI
jgi:hypothetical protein